jgi:hypothetical protein
MASRRCQASPSRCTPRVLPPHPQPGASTPRSASEGLLFQAFVSFGVLHFGALSIGLAPCSSAPVRTCLRWVGNPWASTIWGYIIQVSARQRLPPRGLASPRDEATSGDYAPWRHLRFMLPRLLLAGLLTTGAVRPRPVSRKLAPLGWAPCAPTSRGRAHPGLLPSA